MNNYKIGDIVKTKKKHPCGSDEWEITRIGLDFKLKCKRMWSHYNDTQRKGYENDKIIFGDLNMQKIQKFLKFLVVIMIAGIIILEITPE